MSEQNTSHAKDVELDSYKADLLSAYNETSQEFNNQTEAQASHANNNEAGQENGSSMVRDDAPTLDNRPPPEMAQVQDRETFDEKWQAEQEQAAAKEEYLQQLKESYEENKEMHNDRGHDYGNEFSR